ncbi:PQQ-dependent sugar dehydrogenase [Aggregatimonas sangjinii]|uniref:PQQ-dependent sugar dehydrogenase n=1 Tax=Aggregatimonas sangjinii TaxID=2583587 RepID=A0A5B7SWZ2_9FLAO|nr:PQQ-dependent sugar dehydrogenase [Aggregatimonas sangjinii]QCX01538.1 PQQ-dependent sugar dehydrogenase [Aggregatimonas sangjinii]
MKNRIFLLSILTIGCSEPKTDSKVAIQEVIVPKKETVIDGLARPWSMAFISEEEVLLSEKDGDLLRIDLRTKEKFPIQGFPTDRMDSLHYRKADYTPGTFPARLEDNIKVTFNAGILEVVLDSDYKDNQRLYISYVSKGPGGSTTKVIRATLQNDSLQNCTPLLVALPYSHGLFHYGGGMTFGPDGKLYVTVGERLFNEDNQPEVPIAQDLADTRGKIYRLNPDGSIPEDNPDFGTDAVPGLYASGIRAAQGITVEPQTGKLWFSEHGTRQGDEINVLKEGANYGWPVITTGKYRGEAYSPEKIVGTVYTNPQWYWLQTVAPTGLTFYTGEEFPSWKNNLIVPGLSRGSLWRIRLEGETIKSMEELFIDDRQRSRKAVQSPEGKLYILTEDMKEPKNGKIIRIRPQ